MLSVMPIKLDIKDKLYPDFKNKFIYKFRLQYLV